MALYQLSYDKRGEEDSTQLVTDIATYLKNTIRASRCVRPVETTLIFWVNGDCETVFNGIQETFGSRVYFVITQTPMINGENEYRYCMRENRVLNNSFQTIWNNIQHAR